MSLAGEWKLGRGARWLLALGGALVMLLGAAAPVEAQQNTSPPTIQGSEPRVEGQTLTATAGEWSQGTSVTRQWLRCDTGGANCESIQGATGLSYTLVSADVGRRIRIRETGCAVLPIFCNTATSQPTGVVQPPPPIAPANVVAPMIAGALVEGEFIATTNGTWSGRPAPTFSYQWQRCRPDCVDLPGQTSQAYRLTSADVGARMRAVVTANNSAGSASAASAETASVAARSSGFPAPGGAPPATPPATPPPEAMASLLTPFPVVEIAGTVLRRGARITLLRVRAPGGSDVTVRCRGRNCPARRVTTRVGRRGRLRVRRFQRLLRTGVVIEVFVTKPNRIGKYTRFRIRSRRRPARRDLCVFPGSGRPSRCPSL